MGKIFIRGNKTEDSNIIDVIFKHFAPLDEKHGLSEEQLATGFLVDSIPEPTDCPSGKIPQLKYNISEGILFYDYSKDAPIPPPTMESINEKLNLIMQSLLESEGIL